MAKQRRVYISVRIVDMRRASGSDSARCVKNGNICRGKGEYSGKWCIQRKQRGEAKEPGCDIVQCIDDR